MDISQLTLEEAVALQKQLESALPNLKKQRIKNLQAEIRKLVSAGGFTLDEVLTPLLQNKGVDEATEAKTTGTRKAAAIKYRQGDKTWTGKGKTPDWVRAVEKETGSRESLRVVEAAESEKKGD